jgi:hypothetical protein
MAKLIEETDTHLIYQADFGEAVIKTEGGWWTELGKYAIPKEKIK